MVVIARDGVWVLLTLLKRGVLVPELTRVVQVLSSDPMLDTDAPLGRATATVNSFCILVLTKFMVEVPAFDMRLWRRCSELTVWASDRLIMAIVLLELNANNFRGITRDI